MRTSIVFLLLTPFLAAAQCNPPVTRTWIEFRDNGTCVDTLWFGCDATASYGQDPDLCEFELTAPPTSVCDVRWVNIPGRWGQDTPGGLGTGFMEDYRHCRLGPEDVDTFKIAFMPGDGGFPVTFRWDPIGITSVCDSAILQDEFTGVLVKARMHIVSSVQITNPLFSSILMYVHALGATGVNVTEPNDPRPASFALLECFPNPFNPSTTIEYALPRSGAVVLAIHDILGREIIRLVDGVQDVGRWKITYDASNLGSGVYFYRLQAGDFVQTRKMMLVK